MDGGATKGGFVNPADGYPVTSTNMAYEDVGFRCCRGMSGYSTAHELGRW